MVTWFTSAARGLSYQWQIGLSFGARMQSGFLHGTVGMDDSNLARKRDRQPAIRLSLVLLPSRDQGVARLGRSHHVGHRRVCGVDHG